MEIMILFGMMIASGIMAVATTPYEIEITGYSIHHDIHVDGIPFETRSNLPVYIKMNREDVIMRLWRSHFLNKKYENGVYDCTEFTNDFSTILTDGDINITHTIVVGKLNEEEEFHCWIEIDGKIFEATTGRFPMDTTGYRKIKEMDHCPEYFLGW